MKIAVSKHPVTLCKQNTITLKTKRLIMACRCIAVVVTQDTYHY
ncbi:hypothetical protein OH492_23710 [Vibrio chagasii]|nr:hypothetical protein [Vibrio chagasii]